MDVFETLQEMGSQQMLRRRGCLFGCGSFLILCVAAGLLTWFVAIPRISDAIESGLSDEISTFIADEINPLHSRSELQQGTDVTFSFATINRMLAQETTDENIEGMRITSRDESIIFEIALAEQDFEFEFRPGISSDGELMLEPVDEGGWWQRQFMNVTSGGFEKAINQWLESNDLTLTDVSVDGDTIILSVEGK